MIAITGVAICLVLGDPFVETFMHKSKDIKEREVLWNVQSLSVDNIHSALSIYYPPPCTLISCHMDF